MAKRAMKKTEHKKEISKEKERRAPKINVFDSTAASAWFLIGTTISGCDPEVGMAFVDKFARKKKKD